MLSTMRKNPCVSAGAVAVLLKAAAALRETGVEQETGVDSLGGKQYSAAYALQELWDFSRAQRRQRRKEENEAPCGSEVQEVFAKLTGGVHEDFLALENDPVWEKMEKQIAYSAQKKKEINEKVLATREQVKDLTVKIQDAALPPLDEASAKAAFSTICQEQFKSDCVAAGCGLTKENPQVIGLGNYEKVITPAVKTHLQFGVKSSSETVLESACVDLTSATAEGGVGGVNYTETQFKQCETFCRNAASAMSKIAPKDNVYGYQLERSQLEKNILVYKKNIEDFEQNQKVCETYRDGKADLKTEIKNCREELENLNSDVGDVNVDLSDIMDEMDDMDEVISEADASLAEKTELLAKSKVVEQDALNFMEQAKVDLASVQTELGEVVAESAAMQANLRAVTDAYDAAKEIKVQLVSEIETIIEVANKTLTTPIQAVLGYLNTDGFPAVDMASKLAEDYILSQAKGLGELCSKVENQKALENMRLGADDKGNKGYLVSPSDTKETWPQANKQNMPENQVTEENVTDWAAAYKGKPVGLADLCPPEVSKNWQEDMEDVLEQLLKLQVTDKGSPVKTIKRATITLQIALKDAEDWGSISEGPGGCKDLIEGWKSTKDETCELLTYSNVCNGGVATDKQLAQQAIGQKGLSALRVCCVCGGGKQSQVALGSLKKFKSKFSESKLYKEYLQFWEADDKQAYFVQMMNQLEISLQNVVGMQKQLNKKQIELGQSIKKATMAVAESIKTLNQKKVETQEAQAAKEVATKALADAQKALEAAQEKSDALEAKIENLEGTIGVLTANAEVKFQKLLTPEE